MLFGMNDKVVKPDIWHQEGFNSTDCGEDNDDKEEEKKGEEEEEENYDEDEFEYYDEEEEAEQEEEEKKESLDPSELIEREKIPEQERAMMEEISDIEK